MSLNSALLGATGVIIICTLSLVSLSEAKIQRSAKARHAFMKAHPCPSTGQTKGKCPGYIIDHIIPLKRGGPDDPQNMQWQTKEDAKAKDKWE